MDTISIEDLALLEALVRVDQSQGNPLETENLSARLIEAGLAVLEGDVLTLTHAGVERCKSLHHRVRADAEAAEVIRQREEAEASTD